MFYYLTVIVCVTIQVKCISVNQDVTAGTLLFYEHNEDQTAKSMEREVNIRRTRQTKIDEDILRVIFGNNDSYKQNQSKVDNDSTQTKGLTSSSTSNHEERWKPNQSANSNDQRRLPENDESTSLEGTHSRYDGYFPTPPDFYRRHPPPFDFESERFSSRYGKERFPPPPPPPHRGYPSPPPHFEGHYPPPPPDRRHPPPHFEGYHHPPPPPPDRGHPHFDDRHYPPPPPDRENPHSPHFGRGHHPPPPSPDDDHFSSRDRRQHPPPHYEREGPSPRHDIYRPPPPPHDRRHPPPPPPPPPPHHDRDYSTKFSHDRQRNYPPLQDDSDISFREGSHEEQFSKMSMKLNLNDKQSNITQELNTLLLTNLYEQLLSLREDRLAVAKDAGDDDTKSEEAESLKKSNNNERNTSSKTNTGNKPFALYSYQAIPVTPEN